MRSAHFITSACACLALASTAFAKPLPGPATISERQGVDVGGVVHGLFPDVVEPVLGSLTGGLLSDGLGSVAEGSLPLLSLPLGLRRHAAESKRQLGDPADALGDPLISSVINDVLPQLAGLLGASKRQIGTEVNATEVASALLSFLGEVSSSLSSIGDLTPAMSSAVTAIDTSVATLTSALEAAVPGLNEALSGFEPLSSHGAGLKARASVRSPAAEVRAILTAIPILDIVSMPAAFLAPGTGPDTEAL